MFLSIVVCGQGVRSIIQCILSFIRDNSFLIGGIIALISSCLWLYNLLRQKRAEAFFGFYTHLYLNIKLLRKWLEERGQLSLESESGNIFAMQYIESFRKTLCPSYRPIEENEQKQLVKIATEIKKCLIETDCNVYPKKAKRSKWYESEFAIYDFCVFVENNEYANTTNKSDITSISDPLHIYYCKVLIEAMDYIQLSIERTKY